jgi:hypothetical protein
MPLTANPPHGPHGPHAPRGRRVWPRFLIRLIGRDRVRGLADEDHQVPHYD